MWCSPSFRFANVRCEKKSETSKQKCWHSTPWNYILVYHQLSYLWDCGLHLFFFFFTQSTPLCFSERELEGRKRYGQCGWSAQARRVLRPPSLSPAVHTQAEVTGDHLNCDTIRKEKPLRRNTQKRHKRWMWQMYVSTHSTRVCVSWPERFVCLFTPSPIQINHIKITKYAITENLIFFCNKSIHSKSDAKYFPKNWLPKGTVHLS